MCTSRGRRISHSWVMRRLASARPFQHYQTFVDMLERMATEALERDDLPEHDRCLELAGRFMQQIPQSKLVM